VSPVKYELGFYIPEDGILHIHRLENLKPKSVGTSFPPVASRIFTYPYRQDLLWGHRTSYSVCTGGKAAGA
jgi:hypothetical protein